MSSELWNIGVLIEVHVLTLFQNKPFFFDSLHLIFIAPSGIFPASHCAMHVFPLQSKFSTPFGKVGSGHRVHSAFFLTLESPLMPTKSTNNPKSPFEVKIYWFIHWLTQGLHKRNFEKKLIFDFPASQKRLFIGLIPKTASCQTS